MNLNKVFVLGNLTSDPELRNLSSGQPVCSFGMATNRIWTDRESGEKRQKAEFHNIVAWRNLATIASQYLRKGSLVLVEGRLTTRSWDDPSSGLKRYKTEIVADNIQLAPKALNPQGVEAPAAETSPAEGKAIEADQPSENPGEKTSDSEEEIPTIQEGDDIDIGEVPF